MPGLVAAGRVLIPVGRVTAWHDSRLLPLKFSVLLSCVLLLGPAGAGAAPALEPGRAEALRAVWREGISGGFVPGGVMLVLHRGEPVFREAFGRPDLARPAALSVDTPFRIASVTKPFTATLLAILVAEGRLQWDDPVDRHLPEFRGVRVDGGAPARRPPLVRELLSHTAGFAGVHCSKAFWANG